MIEKVIEVQSAGLKLSLYRGFLVIKSRDSERRLALSDISVLLFSGYGQSISTKLLETLIDQGIMVVFCGNNHQPKSLLLPIAPHHQSHQRLLFQINQTLPFKKSVWQNIVKAKIKFQAEVLYYFNQNDEGLKKLSEMVRSGDPENLEAQAAGRYWKKLFKDNFKRGDEADIRNGVLNYGYAILRACVARWICSLGLNPTLGVHHSNLQNTYCLVDDFMEPFRPAIDLYVKKTSKTNNYENLTPMIKKELIGILNRRIQYGGELRTISDAIACLIHSYIRSIEDKKVKLEFPNSLLVIAN